MANGEGGQGEGDERGGGEWEGGDREDGESGHTALLRLTAAIGTAECMLCSLPNKTTLVKLVFLFWKLGREGVDDNAVGDVSLSRLTNIYLKKGLRLLGSKV